MKSRVFIVITSLIVVLILVSGACSAGFIAGRFVSPALKEVHVGETVPTSDGSTEVKPTPSATNQGATAEDLNKLFEPFWQAWKIVHEEFVDQPVNDVTLMRGAIKGMLESLGDQHTSYMDPDTYTQVNNQLYGEEYEGIGAWVDPRGKYLTIISPMPGSPAEKAGLKAGDQIIAIDGVDMTGVDPDLVRQKVLGPKGTTVRLTIYRQSEEKTFDVDVTRASIITPTLQSKMLDGNIAYVQLFTFGDKTANDLHNELQKLLAQNPAGLILDLRNNGGGFLDTGIAVASEFIGDGVVMYEQYGDGSRKTFEAKPGGLATDIPMVALINQGSASASEIVAGAIQARGRGKLVGVTSFGKGSVQIYTPLMDEQGAVRVTVARWLTPDGKTIHLVGLTPDYKVELTEEDVKANRDPQLDKAVELLTPK